MRYTLVVVGLFALGCGGDHRNDLPDGGGGGDGDGDVVDSEVPVDALPCGQIAVTYRDFQASHPDFEEAQNKMGTDKGIVDVMLGTDNKPVYSGNAGNPTITNASSFMEWYRDVPGTNMTITDVIMLTENPPGTYTFTDNDFFPLDGKGFPEVHLGHNFHFTSEIHGTFVYRGGEVFTFTGDDDVFIFINNRLALDLGGVHGVETGTIDFDAMATQLGIQTNGTYKFDAFHAERHTSESNFTMSTTIDCFVIF